jgi:hypothetical protein
MYKSRLINEENYSISYKLEEHKEKYVSVCTGTKQICFHNIENNEHKTIDNLLRWLDTKY